MVGVAFDAQEVPAVPMGARDQRLDWVITETRALRCAA
jgi:5-formyltetrahydrofolate cyclo-ligase